MRYDICGVDCVNFYDTFGSTDSYDKARDIATAYAYDYAGSGSSYVYIHDNVEDTDIYQW